MTALRKVSRCLTQAEEDRLYFECPGSGIAHGISHGAGNGPRVGVEWELGRADVHAKHSGPIHLVGRPPGLSFVRDRWAHSVS